MTVDGTLDLEPNVTFVRVTVYNGLVLNGTMLLGNASGSTPRPLTIDFGDSYNAAGSLTGSGVVLFGDSTSNNITNASNETGAGGTLTIGPNMSTIRTAENGAIVQRLRHSWRHRQPGDDQCGHGAWIGGDITQSSYGAIAPGAVSNQGTLEATGGTLDLEAALTSAGLGADRRPPAER